MKKLTGCKPKFSEIISTFCTSMDEAKHDYEWNAAEVNRLDHLTQDYLHKLELENLTYADRAKVATQLAHCRQLRRASKDTVMVLQPLIDFLGTDKGGQLLNLMREALGKTRKVEKAMENRYYRNRVLEDEK